MATRSAEEHRAGRVLMLVPSLDLPARTEAAWRAGGRTDPVIGVCSLENNPVLNELGVRTTTNLIQLALWAGHGPVVVLATYAFLVDREDIDAPMASARSAGRWRPL